MIPLADIFGIPTEALTLLFLIALSLVNWIKNRFLASAAHDIRQPWRARDCAGLQEESPAGIVFHWSPFVA